MGHTTPWSQVTGWNGRRKRIGCFAFPVISRQFLNGFATSNLSNPSSLLYRQHGQNGRSAINQYWYSSDRGGPFGDQVTVYHKIMTEQEEGREYVEAEKGNGSGCRRRESA